MYLLVFASFTCMRAVFDIAESMLLEIIWLVFAIAWGSIKLWETRYSVTFDTDGLDRGANLEVLEEDYWSFGQTLPLVLLLLPLLSMAQVYLDDEAKAADATHKAAIAEKESKERSRTTEEPANLSSIHIQMVDGMDREKQKCSDSQPSTSCNIARCSHHPSLTPICTSPNTPCTYSISGSDTGVSPDGNPPLVPPRSSIHSTSPISTSHHTSSRPRLPGHPYHPFRDCPWYNDHILLLISQVLMIASFALFLLTQLSSFLGLSIFLRNRLFLLWILGIIPAASLSHLTIWYLAAWFVKALDGEDWLKRKIQSADEAETTLGFWKAIRFGNVVYWSLRMSLIAGLLVCSFFVSVESAGPHPLMFNY
jgi:hypothetical protein